MSWKELLTLPCPVQDVKTAEYLRRMGFEEDVMRPVYTSEETHFDQIVNLDAPCLMMVTNKRNSENRIKIFINDTEAYMEEISDNFVRSNHIVLNEDLFKETVDDFLDELMEVKKVKS